MKTIFTAQRSWCSSQLLAYGQSRSGYGVLWMSHNKIFLFLIRCVASHDLTPLLSPAVSPNPSLLRLLRRPGTEKCVQQIHVWAIWWATNHGNQFSSPHIPGHVSVCHMSAVANHKSDSDLCHHIMILVQNYLMRHTETLCSQLESIKCPQNHCHLSGKFQSIIYCFAGYSVSLAVLAHNKMELGDITHKEFMC